MNDRFENINLLRAFAAIAVVVYHVIEFTKWTSFPFDGPLVTFRLGWIGVDLFFVISGFVITRSALALHRQDPAAFPRQYWARRLARIVPLYLLTCVLWVVLVEPKLLEMPAKRLIWQIGSHLTFTHSFWPGTFDSIDGVNWTLALEMQFYLAVALSVPWLARTPGWRIWVGCILIAWTWRAAMVWQFGHLPSGQLFMRVMQLPGVLDEFGAGIFLAKLMDRRAGAVPMAGWAWALAAIAAGVACMSVYWPRATYWNDPAMIVFWRTSLAAFFMCVVAAAVHLPQVAERWPLQPLRYLGEVSYGIYLWHMFAVQAVLHMSGITSLQALPVTLGLTILLAMASWHLLEKPILAYGRRFPGRRASQPAAITPGAP